MPKTEGVVKFSIDHSTVELPDFPITAELNAWRAILREYRILGCDCTGQGYGNLSARLQDGTFLITGTQTGHLERLTEKNLAQITRADIAANRVTSRGLALPSSETLTHAALYQIDPCIAAVFHVHSQALWHAGAALGILTTPRTAEYGTPAMARGIEHAYKTTDAPRRRIIVMGGHQDGIVSYGRTLTEAGESLLTALAQALERQKRNTSHPTPTR